MMTAGGPEPAERAAAAAPQGGGLRRVRPGDGGPEVVVLELELRERPLRADLAHPRLHLLRIRGEVLRMATPDRLVTSSRRPAAAASSSASVGPASWTCSKLSTTSRSR